VPTWQSGRVVTVGPNEVLVFGSNRGGHHGMGVAGLAFRGNPDGHYNRDPAFIRAQAAPIGHPDRTGLYAVYGVGRGYQQGREGDSYAVETIAALRPRVRTSLREIYAQLQEMRAFALEHPQRQFLITLIGTGLAGYGEAELELVWNTLETRGGFPPNFTFTRP